MPLPLKETPNEKRCKCGHRFSFLVCIESGLRLAAGSIYALACPDCGEPKIIATSNVSTEEAEEKVRKLVARQVSFIEAQEAYARRHVSEDCKEEDDAKAQEVPWSQGGLRDGDGNSSKI